MLNYEKLNQLQLTNRATHLCKSNWVAAGWPASPTCYRAELGRSMSNHARKRSRSGEPAKLGSARATPSWHVRCGWPPIKTNPYPCVTTSNLAVLCQRVYAEIEGTPERGSAGAHPLRWGVADPYVPPHVCHPAEFGRSGSNGTSVIK